MTALQLQTKVPSNGELFLVLPVEMRGKTIEVRLTPKVDSVGSDNQASEKQTEESVLALRRLRGMLKGNIDLSDLREIDVEVSASAKKKDKPPKLSTKEKEEYVARMNSFRGTLRNVDYSDLREETDREL